MPPGEGWGLVSASGPTLSMGPSIFVETVVGPSAEGHGEMRRGQRRADRAGESASATWCNKASMLIGCRTASRAVDKEIARSTAWELGLHRSSVRGRRQPF